MSSDNKEQAKDIGKLIANSREKLGLSQSKCIRYLNEKVKEYEEKYGIKIGYFSIKTLQQWEQGNRNIKNSSDNCKKIILSVFLDIPINNFYTTYEINLYKILNDKLNKLLTNM